MQCHHTLGCNAITLQPLTWQQTAARSRVHLPPASRLHKQAHRANGSGCLGGCLAAQSTRETIWWAAATQAVDICAGSDDLG